MPGSDKKIKSKTFQNSKNLKNRLIKSKNKLIISKNM